MDVAITKMSSKGQVVIPAEMRGDLHEGEKLLLIQTEKQIILKKVSDMDENLEDDIKFAKRTEEALKKYEKGEFKKMKFNDFLEEIKKW